MTTTLTRMLYRPVGLVCSVASHALAGAVVSRVWQQTHPGEQHAPPTALNSRYGLRVVVLIAMAQGAIVGGVNALVARSGARAFERWTGDWPGS